MSDDLVSVIIPTHNRVDWLGQCLASVLDQRDVRIQAIVVNDGSSDGTREFLAGVDDARLSVVEHETPRGVSAARNAGIAVALGEWLSFVDDDDLIGPEKLATQVTALAGSRATWSCTAAMVVTSTLMVVDCDRPPAAENVEGELLTGNAIPGGGSSVVVAHDALERVGAFDLSLSALADWDLWLRLAGDGRLIAVDEPLLAYRSHDRSSTADVSSFYREAEVLARKHEGFRLHCSGGANFHQARAMAALRSGKRLASAASFFAAAGAHRDWRDLGRALAVCTAPSVRRTSAWYFRRRIPPGWREQTEAWLSRYVTR